MDPATRKARMAALPAKRMGAGALFTNQLGEILLVNPIYKPQWEIPGGIVEANESPRAACIREIFEELQLQIEPHRLLVLDYVPDQPDRTEGLMFVFDGGQLGVEAIARLRLPEDELSEYRFFDVESALAKLTPGLGNRILHAYSRRSGAGTIVLEDGRSIVHG